MAVALVKRTVRSSALTASNAKQAGFLFAVRFVCGDDSARVEKGSLRFHEADSMLGQVELFLLRVPFEFRPEERMAQYCFLAILFYISDFARLDTSPGSWEQAVRSENQSTTTSSLRIHLRGATARQEAPAWRADL